MKIDESGRGWELMKIDENRRRLKLMKAAGPERYETWWTPSDPKIDENAEA